MKSTKILLCATLMMAVTSVAHAKKYGAAGCGLGSMFFKENGKVSQVLAVTTNGTSNSQTFGITSGTSNCASDGTVATNKMVPVYVAANQQALSRDIARGDGETVHGLAAVLGCKDASQLGTELQKNYSVIFNSSNSDDVTDAIRQAITNSKELNSSCRISI